MKDSEFRPAVTRQTVNYIYNLRRDRSGSVLDMAAKLKQRTPTKGQLAEWDYLLLRLLNTAPDDYESVLRHARSLVEAKDAEDRAKKLKKKED